MLDKLLLIDIDKCIRCYACEIACKEENNLSPGPRACRVITMGPRQVQDELHLDFVPLMCLHCDDPYCAHFCPVHAIVKRDDGVVVIDENKCNGCRRCVSGCPYGLMHFLPEKKIAVKCSFCTSRIDSALEPSCVQHCIGGSLQFVSQPELDEITHGQHNVKMGKVCFTSAKWRLRPEMV